MPPKDFVSLTISQEHADRLQRVRNHLRTHGIAALPEHFRPATDGGAVHTVMEAALLMLEEALKLTKPARGAAGGR